MTPINTLLTDNTSNFLSGGGEMGAHIRSLDWSKTAMGSTDTWPQSLRTILSVILNSKFPMFLYWGPELNCFYNDAFRPSLGDDGKHPSLLGKPGKEFWSEAWHEIGPTILSVKAGGEAVWSEDQLIPIYRNGKVDKVYWTYSFSPVFDESGTPGGVLVTSIETTQRVLTLARLEESTDELSFAIEATELATFDVNPITNQLKGNNRLKEWFGLEKNEEVDIQTAIDVIADKDKKHVQSAIERAYQYTSGGKYEIEYTIINPATKQKRYVRAKGKVWFNENKEAYRFNGTLQDITKMVLARKQLQESESRFRNLIKQVPVAIGLTRGKDHVFEDINLSMLHLIDRKHENDVIGKEMTEVLPELKGQPAFEIYQKVLESGVPFIGNEVPIQVSIEGKLKLGYYNISYTPLIEYGRVTGIIHAAIDVTEQVLTRQKLEESERQILAIIESSSSPLAVYMGEEMYIQFANKAMIETYGKGPDVIGKTFREVMPELENQGAFDQLEQVYTTGIPFHSRNHQFNLVINGQFETHYFTYSFIPLFKSSGEIYGIVNTAYDVTDLVNALKKVEAYTQELQESEQRFRIMADASPAMIWALNPDSSLKYANKLMLDFLGITFEKFVADNWVPYLPVEDLHRTNETIGKAIAERRPFRNEHRFLRHDGQYRWLLAQGAPSYYPNGEMYGYVGSSIDITEIKQAEQKLQRYAEKLATTNEELRETSERVLESNEMLSSTVKQLSHINADLDNFIYTASHDLLAPISNIEGLMYAIQDELPKENRQDPEMSKLFELVNTSILRFKQTITDLTEITKLEREDAIDSGTQVYLEEVINEVRLDLSLQIDKARATFDVNLQECEALNFSPKNARSIIYNLVSNALKYRSPERPLLIQIRCYKKGKFQVLSVQDNGLGINLKDESKVFGMFRRLHDHVEGSGVGLYIVKKIIENAGGNIEVESIINKGSIFRVFFPCN
ncbi:PAS domain-containing protein [Pontibacter sp. H259]|uniref:PAS domain-containing sensor histidine kinase n=1 Tax=Pontibacter sp. H259 TaxID=3133421 RepID=UPI0030BB4D39